MLCLPFFILHIYYNKNFLFFQVRFFILAKNIIFSFRLETPTELESVLSDLESPLLFHLEDGARYRHPSQNKGQHISSKNKTIIAFYQAIQGGERMKTLYQKLLENFEFNLKNFSNSSVILCTNVC